MSKMSELSYDLQQAAMIIADHNYDLREENKRLKWEIVELKAALESMTLRAMAVERNKIVRGKQ